MSVVYPRNPVFFITTTVLDRHPVLANQAVFRILMDEWRESLRRHDWNLGRFVVMPDHVHFFCSPGGNPSNLSIFVGRWKEYTSKALRRESLATFRWQSEFFDHLLRGSDSYDRKWGYVRENPVRAGLVDRAEDWPFAGEMTSLRF